MNNNNVFLAKMSKKITSWKKQILIFIFLLIVCSGQLFSTANVQAGTLWNSQEGMTQVGGAFGETGSTPRDLKDIIITGVEVFLGFMGMVMVIFIIYGGAIWMTAGGNEDRVKSAKKTLIAAVIGAIVIFCAYIIAYFVANTARQVITGQIW